MQRQLDRLEGKFDKILKSKAKKSSLSPSPIPAPVPQRSDPLGSPGKMFASYLYNSLHFDLAYLCVMLLFIQAHIIFYLVASPPLLKRRESESGAFNSGIGL